MVGRKSSGWVIGFAVTFCVLASGTTARATLILVCNQQGTSIGEYTTSGATVNTSFITGLSCPSDMALDGDGHIFVVNNHNRAIGEYTTSGATVNASLITTPFYPWGIALDGNGHIFVSGSSVGDPFIAEYTTSGAVVNLALITTGLHFPLGIASDGNGHLFVANAFSGTIGEFTTEGAHVTDFAGLSYPVDIAYDGNGNIFVADQLRGVFEYTTSGGLVHANLAPDFHHPCSIALDGQGHFFVGGEPTSGITVPIGEYTTSGVPVNPLLITGLDNPAGLQILAEPTPEPMTSGMALLGLSAIGMFLTSRRGRTNGLS